MSALAPVARAAASAEASASGLRVFVHCPPWVLAISAERVERLLLRDEVYLDRREDVNASAALGLVRVGPAVYPAWDLGLLLGLEPQRDAWVLLRVPFSPAPLALALRTGPCLSAAVLPASALRALPEALCRDRPGLVTGAFATRLLRLVGRSVGPIGLALDVAKLLSEEHAIVSAALLSDAGVGAP
jgi:hypothetical protein